MATSNRRPTQGPLEQESEFEEQAGGIEIVSTSSLQAIEGAQSLAQVRTAHIYKRPEIEEIRKELKDWVTIDEETATECFYSLRERAGTESKPIEGPSARFAEIAMAAYGNMRAGAQTIGNDGKRITALGVAWDLQRNNAVQMSADRSIMGRDGKTYRMDMQITTAMAANSIAYRNAVLKVIPPNYWKPAYLAARKKAAGEGPIDQRFAVAVKLFRVFGITKEQLLAYIGVAEVADLSEDNIASLKGLYTSLKDNQTTVQESFKGINRDGTRQQAPDSSSHEGNHGEPSEPGEAPVEISDDAKGPFEASMFHPAELESLTVAAKKHGHVGNQAQLFVLLGKWEGTKRELIDVLTKPRAK
jgi:hypothetical protein